MNERMLELYKQEILITEYDEDQVSYIIPFVCIAEIVVLTFMMVVSK